MKKRALGLALAGVTLLCVQSIIDDPSVRSTPDDPSARAQAAQQDARVRGSQGHFRSAGGDAAEALGSAEEDEAPSIAALRRAYRTDQVIVSVREDASLSEVAANHGVEVVSADGFGGYGAISVPHGAEVADFLRELRSDERVRSASPEGTILGAGSTLTVPEATTQLTEAEQAVADAIQAIADAELALAAAEVAEDAAKDVKEAAKDAHQIADEAVAAAEDAGEPYSVISSLKSTRSDAEDVLEDAEKALKSAKEATNDAKDALNEAEDDLNELENLLDDAVNELEDAEKQAEKDRVRALREIQWFLKKSRHPRWSLTESAQELYVQPDYSGIVIAILDTGVAYEDHEGYRQAPTLGGSPIVAPHDFVNSDTHANDDHQHGTHIASIIASQGDLYGIAPGVTLMPVKVLDADNTGSESWLVAGIHHAVDNGADIINMSLSFSEGYIPSPALLDAIERARAAGVVMIAASGNSASGVVTWPAASPDVIAVSSVSVKDKGNGLRGVDYANISTLVDMVAAGGVVGEDLNNDGIDDGILGESIALNDPDSFGYWLYAGTSQAAAMVSGSAAHLLHAGATPEQVQLALQYTSQQDVSHHPYEEGYGAGSIDLEDAIEEIEDAEENIQERPDYHVALMPYLESKHDGERIVPRASITVLDRDGAPAEGVKVYGIVQSAAGEVVFECGTNGEGTCTVALDEIDLRDENDLIVDPGLAWMWRVDTVVKHNVGIHPSPALFATDGFAVLDAAIQAEPQLSEGLLALHWPETEDEELGDLAESYLAINGGTGLSSSPLGLLMTPGALGAQTTIADINVDLDGTGLSSSPLGIVTLRQLTFDGTGLSSSPLGLNLLSGLQFTVIDGTGLSSSPLGFHGMHLFLPEVALDGTGLASSPLGFNSNPMLLRDAVIIGTGLASSPLGVTLAEGGWATPEGYSGATLLAASGLMDAIIMPTSLEGEASGSSSAGAAILDESLLPAYITQMYAEEAAAE